MSSYHRNGPPPRSRLSEHPVSQPRNWPCGHHGTHATRVRAVSETLALLSLKLPLFDRGMYVRPYFLLHVGVGGMKPTLLKTGPRDEKDNTAFQCHRVSL